MNPQDLTPAERASAADLIVRYDDALAARQTLRAQRWALIRTAKAANTRLDSAALNELNGALSTADQRVRAIGDALALLGLPPSPSTRAMSLAEYRALPPEYKESIELVDRMTDARRAARKGGGQ
jgi:hypothetical protein